MTACKTRAIIINRTQHYIDVRDGHSNVTDGAVFVLPVSSSQQAMPIASWITTSGWATAAQRRWGNALIVTPDGDFTPDQALSRASKTSKANNWSLSRWKWAPDLLVTAGKDVRGVVRARRFTKSMSRRDIDLDTIEFVWQRHVPFHRAGWELARSADCPMVLCVHALFVQEARQWGTRRPGWGWLIERFGEKRLLRQADLVACVSKEIAALVENQGISPDKIVVTPNGVDLQRFKPTSASEAARSQIGVDENSFVLGWVGTFRAFHGLEQLFEAMERLEKDTQDVTLLLVGLGPGIEKAHNEVSRRGLRRVVFAGGFPHDQMPAVLSVMDAAVVLGNPDQGFHYSPVKLREYMAMGIPVIAARLGELERLLTDEVDSLLIAPGDSQQLAQSIERLIDDSDLRENLGNRARKNVQMDGSWDAVLEDVFSRLQNRHFH